jgi:hypothetical protein
LSEIDPKACAGARARGIAGVEEARTEVRGYPGNKKL